MHTIVASPYTEYSESTRRPQCTQSGIGSGLSVAANVPRRVWLAAHSVLDVAAARRPQGGMAPSIFLTFRLPPSAFFVWPACQSVVVRVACPRNTTHPAPPSPPLLRSAAAVANMSSLASQLGQLRSLNAQRLATSAQDKHAHVVTSYLYSAREAGFQDLRTAHSIAANGWDEACIEHPDLSEWAESEAGAPVVAYLLGDASVSRDRTLLSVEDNRQLDAYIQVWLARLAGLITDRHVAKVIEWLVRRFRVQEFNVQSLIATFLPYHETPYFARIVQISNLDQAPLMAFFLKPYQHNIHAGASTGGLGAAETRAFPLSSLISALSGATDTTHAVQLLRWIASLIHPSSTALSVDKTLASLPPHRALLSFWLSTLVHFSVLCSGQPKDSLSSLQSRGAKVTATLSSQDASTYLSVLLPAASALAGQSKRRLDKAPSKLFLHAWQDALVGASMLFSTVAGCFDLTPEAVSASLDSLLESPLPTKLGKQATGAVLLGCYSLTANGPYNRNQQALSVAHTRALLSMPGAIRSMRETMAESDISSFLTYLMTCIVLHWPEFDPATHGIDAVAALESLVLAPNVAETGRQETIDTLVTVLVGGKDRLFTRQRALVDILAKARQLYPATFSRALEHQGRLLKQSNQSSSLLTALVAQSSFIMHGASTDDHLWLAAHSDQVPERVLALKELVQSEESSGVKDLLLSALVDPAPEVLEVVYQGGRNSALLRLAKPNEVVTAITAIFADQLFTNDHVEAARLHAAFLLNEALPQLDQCQDALRQKVFTTALFPYLASTPETQQVSAALHKELSTASLEGEDYWTSLLRICQQSDSGAAQTSRALAGFLAQQDAAPETETVLTFLLSQGKRAQATSSPSSGLALLTLGSYLERSRLTSQSAWPRWEAILQLSSELLHASPALDKVLPLAQAAYDLQSKGAVRSVSCNLASGIFQAAVAAVPRGSEETIGKQYFIGDSSHAALLVRDIYLSLVSGILGVQGTKKLLLQLMEALGPALATALASFGTDTGVPASARALALQHVGALFSAYAAKAKKLDMQALIPSLIIPLSDKEEGVRLAATGALQVLAKLYALPDEAEGIFAFDAVYGTERSKQVLYLQPADASALVNHLVGHAKAIVAGSHNVVQFLGQTLTVLRRGDKKDGKKAVHFKHSVLENLLSHAVAWPSWQGTADLLAILAATQSSHKVQRLAPVLGKLVDSVDNTSDEKEKEQIGRAVDLMFSSYEIASSDKMSESSDSWRVLKVAVGSPSGTCPFQSVSSDFVLTHRQPTGRVRQDACKAVVRIFSSIHPAMQLELVLKLVISGAKPNDEHARLNVDALHTLRIPDQIYLSAVNELRTSLEDNSEGSAEALPPATKRSRRAEPDSGDKMVHAGALTILLGVAHSRHAVLSVDLVAEYFDVMKLVNDLRSSGLFNTELVLKYAVQTLSATASQGRKDALLWTHFRVDVLLNIVKLPLSVSLIHSVLQLLAQVAQVAPEQVVHNIMPIFTFVGSSFLSRDDRGSFAMVEMVIRDIVPALVTDYKTHAPEGDEFALLLRCRDLLRIFTGAAKYMPKYRRVSFFKLLVRVLGADQFLGPVCMLFVDQQFKKAAKPGSSVATALDLPLSVWHQFTGEPAHLTALFQTLDEVDRLLSVGATDAVTASSHVFLDRLAESSDEHSNSTADVPKQANALLAFITAALEGLPSGTHRGLTPLAMRALDYYTSPSVAPHAAQVIDAAAEHMSTDDFVSFLSSNLTSHFALCVRLLQARQTRGETLGRHAALFLPVLVPATVASHSSSELAPACLSVLQILASDVPSSALPAWTAAVPAVLQTAQTTTSIPNVQAALYALLASLTHTLGPRMIPFTVPVVSAVQATLASQVPVETEKACIALLGKLSHSLPSFMASHLATLISLAVDLTVRHPGPPSLLVGTVINQFAPEDVVAVAAAQVASSTEAIRTSALLDLVRRLVAKRDRKTVVKIYKPVFRILLDAYDVRRAARAAGLVQDAEAGIELVEDASNAAFLQVILKLNETLFRPLFLRFYDWAAIDLAEDENPILDSGIRARLLTFFRFYVRMQDTLKQLISSYDATVLDLKLELLEAQRLGTVDDAPLWTEVQTSIAKSAQYDEGGFWNAARAARAVPVLIQQLDIVATGTMSTGLVQNAVATSVTSIARAVGEEGVLKGLNRDLLDVARRASSTAVAMAAVSVLQHFWTEVGDDLLALVPETAPFLSELLGNPNPEVVEATQDLVRVIEKVLGEPMDQYLS